MDLATIKEENHLAPGALVSEVFAPRYMTRSKAVCEPKGSTGEDRSISSDSNSSGLAEQQSSRESFQTTASEWETETYSETQSSAFAPEYVALVHSVESHEEVSSGRKRGRHKEYTAPTGVWKTNGGYISTIYVGNKRIYGPLRDSPEEAGVDRQKLIEAKAFATTEPEMRSFIATLKQTSALLHLVTKQQQELSTQSTEPITKRTTSVKQPSHRRRHLSTVTSTAMTIEA